MWALCPPSYHDNDMPIDLRKKVVLQRELDEQQREYYRGSDNIYASKDHHSVQEYPEERWPQQQRPGALPVHSLHPLAAKKYRCTQVPDEDRDKPQDLRPAIRGTLETAIKKLHTNKKLQKAQQNGKEERCRSAEASLEEGGLNSRNRPPRSNSCPDLTVTEQKPFSNQQSPTHSSNGSVTFETKHHIEYNEYSPEREDVNSPVIGGARKRKSFIPLYGDRAPLYERSYRSPSPQNPVCNERDYRSPSPKRPIYIRNGYHSPSPERYVYNERIYRSPSPKRPLYSERHYYSPSPTRPIYDDRRFHSPSPKRPVYVDRGFRSPSPKRRPKSPTDQSSYEEYFSHPEVLLRRQLNQHSTSPYFLHVYDYYQHLVQRLREHSSPNVRINSPVSPTPIEEDTNPDAQRKRPCRALTGKHVRQGTGASLSTLLTLRQKIQERQKAKEHQPRNVLNGINNKNGTVKKSNPKKVKLNMKGGTLGKIQNC